MSRSHGKKSKTKVRHHRQIKDQRYREQKREEKQYVPEAFSFGLFLRKRAIELLIIGAMIAGVVGITFLGPDKKALKEMRDSVSSVIQGQEMDWDEAYPHGYKIIALTDKGIIHTSYATLPEDLKIDWENISITRVQVREFGSTEEKIKISLSDIEYAPLGISGLTARVSFIRKKGASMVLARLGNFKFVVEVIEDTGEQVFCLFGLQDI